MSRAALPGEVLAIEPHNSVATSSSLRFWARSIGDRNPRYVSDSQFRDALDAPFEAHPCWLYSVHDSVVHISGGAHVPIFAAGAWTFGRPVKQGERIRPVARLVSERKSTGRHAGDHIVQEVEVTYLDDRDQAVATTTSTLFHVDPHRAKSSLKYSDWKRTRYTESQLIEIEAAYDEEDARPSELRYFDDVKKSETLPRIVRGPVTSEEMTMFVGATRPASGIEQFTRDRLEGKIPAFIHPGSSTYETYRAGVVDDASAQQLGFPAAHDLGIDRISYSASLLCNWMGPRGILRSLQMSVLEPVMLGDTSWCYGRVSELEPLDGIPRGTVTIEVWNENQHGQVTSKGTARVELDRRDEGS